jgi:hypothetical protein
LSKKKEIIVIKTIDIFEVTIPMKWEKISVINVLINLYNHKVVFRLLVPDREKQKLLRQYILDGKITDKEKPSFISKK